jgi:hypothetical protein
MIYNGVTVNGRPKPAFLCGPGDPEDFFYNNTQVNIDLLKNRGAKITYITAYEGDFGGGNPGAANSAQFETTLTAWDGYITQLENAGITTVFFFFDDSIGMPSDWQTAVDKIVNKFKYHKLLIWSVAEEYSEALTSSQVSQVAQRILAADNNHHIVGVHQLESTSFDFNSNANLSMFLIQHNVGTADEVHSGVKSAWSNTQGNKIINMAEIVDHAKKDRTTVRQFNWGSAMGGASVIQILWMGRATDPTDWNDPAKYNDCTTLTNFFESTTINDMVPNDSLAFGNTQWALANPGSSYIGYSRSATSMGFRGLTAGMYDFKWLDPVSGTTLTETKSVVAGDQSWSKPAGFGSEVALYIQRTSVTSASPTPAPSPSIAPSATPQPSATNVAPVAQTKTISTSAGMPVYIQLSFSDSDGPGPYTYTIVAQPANGSLTGVGNDRTYTPRAGFTGTDTFTWRVNDSLANSNIATVTITVTCQKGDANCDGVINGVDMGMLLTNYAAGNTQTDFLADGKVNMLDAAYVILGFNQVQPTPQPTATPGQLVSNLLANDTVNAAAWSIATNLQVGNQLYGDRTFTIATVPTQLLGSWLIRTANSSKSFTTSPLVSFTLNQAATVYVALDVRITTIPSWIAAWTDTGENLTSNGLSGIETFRIYAKQFPPGTVTLGAQNAGTAVSMYTVIVN